MASIFKYTGRFGIETLRDKRIKVSTAKNLNDPFELSPQVNPASISRQMLAKTLRQDCWMHEAYLKEGLKSGFTNKKAFKRSYLKSLPQRVEELHKHTPRNAEQMQAEFAERYFDKSFRLFCASRRHDSILMWSHYADNHEGMVIEFDTSQYPFSLQNDDFFMDVDYANSDEKPFFVPPIGEPPEVFGKRLMGVVRVKAADWKYEAEVRVVFPLELTELGVTEKGQAEKRFFKIDPQAVKSVLLGCRCRKELAAGVFKELSVDHYAHVEVYQATLSKTYYRLEFNRMVAQILFCKIGGGQTGGGLRLSMLR